MTLSSFSARVSNGIAWTLGAAVWGNAISIIFTIILANFLTPAEFGVVAVLIIYIELGNVLANAGLSQALIRKKNLTPEIMDTAFYANISMGLIFYAFIYFLAPHLEKFYQVHSLCEAARMLGLCVIFNSAKIIQVARLSRAMNFRVQSLANSIGVLAGGIVALTLAAFGYGFYALIAQMLVASIASTVFLWLKSDWRPGLGFSMSAFHSLFTFGGNLLLANSIDVVFRNAFVVVIGKILGADAAGYYHFASRIGRGIPQMISRAIQQVTYPAFSSVRDDLELSERFRQAVQVAMFIIVPFMLILAALVEPLFSLLLPEKWATAILYTQLFCILGVIFPLNAMNINLLNVMGKSGVVLRLGILKQSVQLVTLYFTCRFGVLYIILGQVAIAYLSMIPNAFYSARYARYGVSEQIKNLVTLLAMGFLAATCVYWLQVALNFNHIFEIVLSGAVGVVVYVCLSAVLRLPAYEILSTYIKLRKTKVT